VWCRKNEGIGESLAELDATQSLAGAANSKADRQVGRRSPRREYPQRRAVVLDEETALTDTGSWYDRADGAAERPGHPIPEPRGHSPYEGGGPMSDQNNTGRASHPSPTHPSNRWGRSLTDRVRRRRCSSGLLEGDRWTTARLARGALLRLGHAVPAPGQGLRTAAGNRGRPALRRLRLPHASQAAAPSGSKSMTRSRMLDVGRGVPRAGFPREPSSGSGTRRASVRRRRLRPTWGRAIRGGAIGRRQSARERLRPRLPSRACRGGTGDVARSRHHRLLSR
jgi:hypothetical protein